MFKRFQKILTSAAEALAPELPQLETFVYHWKGITSYFLESQDGKIPIEETPVSSHLHSLLGILIDEEAVDEYEGTGPCMEYLLHNKLLDTLYTLGRADCPLGMKQKVLWFFTGLISKIKQPLLPHVNVYKPVHKLLRICGEIKASPAEVEEMRFLCTVCSKLKEDPYVVNFFLEDARVVVKACEGLLLCCSLPEDSAAKAILQNSKLVTEVVGWLLLRYQALPLGADAQDIEVVEAQWGMNVVSAQEKQSFAGCHHVVAFVALFDYCDQLVKLSHPSISRSLSKAVHTHFLRKMIKNHLLPGKLDERAQMAVTAYLIKCVCVTTTDLLLDEYCSFVCVDSQVQDTLISRCASQSEQVSLLNLRLYEALLRKPNLDLLYHLMLKYLLVPGPHRLPNQGQPNQGQPNQGQPNQGQPNQGQPNQGQPYQGQPNQGQPNQGQPNQGQPNKGQLAVPLVNGEAFAAMVSASDTPKATNTNSESDSACCLLEDDSLDDLDFATVLSKITACSMGEQTDADQVVNFYLTLLPAHVQCPFQPGDCTYEIYLKDAFKQVSSLTSTEGEQRSKVISPDEQGSNFVSPGPFMEMLLNKLLNFVNQSYRLNLQLTSVLSKLAMYPQWEAHQYLLHPFLSPSTQLRPALPLVLRQVCDDLVAKASTINRLQEKLISRRRVLSEIFGEITSFDSPEEETYIDNIILMEEFLKELAAIAFVKQQTVPFR